MRGALHKTTAAERRTRAPREAVHVGPQDHGRRMRLADFDRAIGREGYLYELSRGIVIVSDVPNPQHFAQLEVIRDLFIAYKLTHPGQVRSVGGGAECKILLPDFESERHPDISVYKKPRPRSKSVWADWIPDLAIEIVSPGSEERDYVLKREEYLDAGVREYWVVNAERKEVLVLRRVGARWSEKFVRPPAIYRPRLFPGLELDCAAVFRAADEARKRE